MHYLGDFDFQESAGNVILLVFCWVLCIRVIFSIMVEFCMGVFSQVNQ